MMKNILLTFLTLFCIAGASSQEMTIKGNLMDTIFNQPSEDAVVVVIRMKDSVLIDFARSDAKGAFEMKMPFDTVEILITQQGFDDKSVFFFPSDDNYELDLVDLPLPPVSDELAEIMIVANKEPIYFRGDTLVYNANAFETKENAVVEDLLKKLPGITVDENGLVSSQGREVSKILVDGDEFFGDDPTIATKNLGADGVESVKVYETEDEDAEAGSDEKIQVMDLTLKEDAKKGYFGRVSGATDFQNFYEGEVLFNRFAGSQKISFFALGSNTPRSGFDWAEANKFGLSNEMQGGRFSNFTSNNSGLQGVPRTFKTGIYYRDKLSKNIKFGADYTYNNNDLDKAGDQTSQYFLSDTTYFTDEITSSIEHYESHALNLNFDIKLDSLTKLEIRPELDYSTSDNALISNTIFRSEDLDTTSTTSIFNSSNQTNYAANVRARLNRKFMKPKRELILTYDYNLTNNQDDARLRTNSQFYGLPIPDQLVDQSQVQEFNSSGHSGQIFYSEPIGERFTLNVDYLLHDSVNSQLNPPKNSVGGAYIDFDSLLSNNFETVRSLNRGGLKLRYKKSKLTFGVGAQFRNIQIENIDLAGTTINQNINNLLPNANLQIKFSKSKRWNINYRTFSNQPAVSQLQPVANNTDPNRIVIGNLDLRPNYTHNISTSFNTWKAMSGFYLWTSLNYRFIEDDFSNSVTFDSFGRTVSKAVNVDGNQNGNLYFGMGIPVNPVFKISPGLNMNYFKNSSFVNDDLNITETSNVGASAKFEYTAKSDSLTFYFGGSYNYSNPTSTLSFAGNQPFSTQVINGGFDVELPFKMSLNTSASYTMNTQRADGYNINFLIIDAELSKRFLKTENLVLSLIGNDILNQNVIANRTIQDNVIIDNRTSIISRYFLLKLSLKFNSTKTHEEDPKRHW